MIASALALVMFVSHVEATHPHRASGAYAGSRGNGVHGVDWGAVVICGIPEGCQEPNPTIARIGGANVWSEHGPGAVHYSNIHATGQDFTNTPLPIAACIYPSSQTGGQCMESNGSPDPDCSNTASVRGGEPGERNTVFVYSVWVLGTQVCFGTTSDVDVSWF